ncbi:hypothetical protein AAMO2058_001123000 [Amorphochlora amoebiformis]
MRARVCAGAEGRAGCIRRILRMAGWGFVLWCSFFPRKHLETGSGRAKWKVDTFAGCGDTQEHEDGTFTFHRDGMASTAIFSNPMSISCGKQGVLYVADTGNHAIRSIQSDGTVNTFAGIWDTYGDGNPFGHFKRWAALSSPAGVLAHPNGDIYIPDTESHTIRKIFPDGRIINLVGCWYWNLLSDMEHPICTDSSKVYRRDLQIDGVGDEAFLDRPMTMALHPDGHILTLTADPNRIRKINPTTRETSTFVTHRDPQRRDLSVCHTSKPPADPRSPPEPKDPPIRVQVGSGPRVSLDSEDLCRNPNVCHRDPDTCQENPDTCRRDADTCFRNPEEAGCLDSEGGGEGYREEDVKHHLHSPPGLSVGSNGVVYRVGVGQYSHRILKIDPDGYTSILSGNGEPGYRDGSGKEAQFRWPRGLDCGPDGTIYVADTANCAIRSITPEGMTETVAGKPYHPHLPSRLFHLFSEKTPLDEIVEKEPEIGASNRIESCVDGDGEQARFSLPTGLSVDRERGIIFVADAGNAKIRKLTPLLTDTSPRKLKRDFRGKLRSQGKFSEKHLEKIPEFSEKFVGKIPEERDGVRDNGGTLLDFERLSEITPERKVEGSGILPKNWRQFPEVYMEKNATISINFSGILEDQRLLKENGQWREPRVRNKRCVTAKFSFENRTEHEIAFKEGDYIYLTGPPPSENYLVGTVVPHVYRHDPETYIPTNDDKIGYIPRSYVSGIEKNIWCKRKIRSWSKYSEEKIVKAYQDAVHLQLGPEDDETSAPKKAKIGMEDYYQNQNSNPLEDYKKMVKELNSTAVNQTETLLPTKVFEITRRFGFITLDELEDAVNRMKERYARSRARQDAICLSQRNFRNFLASFGIQKGFNPSIESRVENGSLLFATCPRDFLRFKPEMLPERIFNSTDVFLASIQCANSTGAAGNNGLVEIANIEINHTPALDAKHLHQQLLLNTAAPQETDYYRNILKGHRKSMKMSRVLKEREEKHIQDYKSVEGKGGETYSGLQGFSEFGKRMMEIQDS